jgi:hypothetical protein
MFKFVFVLQVLDSEGYLLFYHKQILEYSWAKLFCSHLAFCKFALYIVYFVSFVNPEPDLIRITKCCGSGIWIQREREENGYKPVLFCDFKKIILTEW